ncbi:hypothetical protein DEO72_LG5g2101 [Vigna unguiculata]|uniref:Uncharacterized protein n=1 Tax=Vigna unguiculata TaxID=3917 RepID=A0A4D6LZV4_VIGUN|nr:hypothetical protein DEO72_LG5g2101 [Vigna unguiculata]
MIPTVPLVLRILEKNVNFDRSDEKVMSVLDDKDLLVTEARMDEQITRNTLGTKIPESLSAPTHADGNKNKEDNQHLVDHKSIIEITKGKCCNELKPADENDVSAEPTQDTPLILNHRIRRCLLGPMKKIRKEHVVPETVVQNQKNNTLNELQFERINSTVKKVHFSEKVEGLHPKRKLSNLESSHKRFTLLWDKLSLMYADVTESVTGVLAVTLLWDKLSLMYADVTESVTGVLAAAPRAAMLAIVPPRLLLTLPPGEFRARPGEVSSPKRAGVLASTSVIEFSPKRRGTRLSESPSRLSEIPWPERPVWARVRAGWVFTSLLFCVWCAIVHNSLESLGETFRVALQWSGHNSMAPLGGEQLGGEQRYPPQVWASAESDQVIHGRGSRGQQGNGDSAA